MCGICGIFGFEDKKLIRRMTDVIKHRGPDDKGYYTNKDLMLGHRRLSIIDLKTGKQPIHNEDESVWVIYNGEIYNYKELRKSLEKKHSFYTSSDTEVIVHLYEEFGDRFIEKLRGIFTLALFDCKKRKLYLARDRLGIKPLYYTILGKSLIFSSEIKSIIQCEKVKREVDYDSLFKYLTFRYVPDENTMLKGVKKLLPGHFMVFRNGKSVIKKYWSLDIVEKGERGESFYREKLKNLLEESVKIRLMSDVPLGVYLSGGFDSSSVVALMSKMVEEPIKTISIGFGHDDPVDELKYARFVSDHFGTEHHEIVAGPECIKLLPKIIWHLDEPITDATTIPTYIISEFAKKYLTVAMTGEGGDEMFGGYVQYKSVMLGERFMRMFPSVIGQKLAKNLVKISPQILLDKFFEYPYSLGERGKSRLLEYISSMNDRDRTYLLFVSLFNEEDKKNLYSANSINKIDFSRLSEEIKPNFGDSRGWELLSSIFSRELKTWLPNYILLRLDKMTMASAIEGRVPFLDHKLVEFCANIPFKLKIRGFNEKYLFRKTLSDLLPKVIRDRKKHPFFIPIDAWFNRGIKDLAEKILSESTIKKRSYFKYDYIRKIFRSHEKSKLIYSRQLWSLLTFELWHRIYIDSDHLQKPKLSMDYLENMI